MHQKTPNTVWVLKRAQDSQTIHCMYGNKHKIQTQLMETTNAHEACTRSVAKKMLNKLNTKDAKNMVKERGRMW